MMRILIDVNHPAHIHLFRYAAHEWVTRGHKVFWTARDKDLVVDLLRHYGFEFEVLSTYRRGVINMGLEVISRDWKLLRLARRINPDIMIGTSVNITHVSRLIPAHSIFFTDSDPHLIRTIAYLSFPFADVIVTPDSIPDEAMPAVGRSKWIKHASTHKLAYLHPNRFTPDPAVLDELGVTSDEPFFILRFISWGASHDLREAGLSLDAQRQLVQLLSSHGRVFITSEAPLQPEFEAYRVPIAPYRIHDALYYATMFIGDSQSMTTEAAILGTPALRCNSMVGRTTVIDELEYKYDLTYGFLPENQDQMLVKIVELLNKENLHQEWQQRRFKMLEDKIDLTAWIVEFVEKFQSGLL